MLQSRWSRVLGVLSLVGAVAGLAGCENQGAEEDGTEVAASEVQQAGDATNQKPAKERGAKEKGKGMGEHGPGMRGERGHGPGPGMLLGAALHELDDLSDAQKKTIEAELESLHADMKDAREDGKDDHEAARKALAAAVRSGKIDESALAAQAPKAPMDTARIAKAIGVLHDTLNAAQRKALVAAMSEKMARFGGPEGRPGHGPDGDDDDARPAKGERGERGERMGGPLGHMLRGIDLSDAQRESVKTALEKLAPSDADREAMKAQREAFKKAMTERLQTFAADSFDAAAFVARPAGDAKMGPKDMHAGMVKALAAVVPLLDDAQRAELAKRIEEGPRMGRHMGKHARD